MVRPEHTALLLIDIQNDFTMPGGYFDKLGRETSSLRGVIPRVKTVLEAARRHRVMVIHAQLTLHPDFLSDSAASLRLHLRLTGTGENDPAETLVPYCIEGSWGWQIVDDLAPLPGEMTIRKNRSSAFIGTNLDMLLRANGIKTVCIGGLVSHGCVLATASDASFLDYNPVLLRDCIASNRPELHDAAMLIMTEVKDVTDGAEAINVWA